MINEIGNPPQYPDLFNDNFEENLKKLSADQIRDLDLNAMQDFGKQKEMEYKKDYEEFRGYYDRWSQDLTQHKRSLEESQKKLINKIIEMENKYGLYIYGRDQWEKIPKDFKNTWILASDTIHKQYEFIRKTEHTSEDINSLWAENMQVIFSPF